MRKRIRQYHKHVEHLLLHPPKDVDWDAVITEHLQQIAFFQHERLVHLIVTMTFAVLTMLSVGWAILGKNLILLLLTAVLLLLLIPYICHYYLLENHVQCMYDQYDRMQRLRKSEMDSQKVSLGKDR